MAVTRRDLPPVGDVTSKRNFDALDFRFSGLQESAIRLREAHIRTIDFICRCRECEGFGDIPLQADFVVLEFFRLKLLGRRGDAAELVT